LPFFSFTRAGIRKWTRKNFRKSLIRHCKTVIRAMKKSSGTFPHLPQSLGDVENIPLRELPEKYPKLWKKFK
jgi:hypothetical protein